MMKALITILAVLLALPVIFVIGIALGPAILVLLFIAGFALIISALAWVFVRAIPR